MSYKYRAVIDTEIEDREDILRIFYDFYTDKPLTSQEEVEEISLVAIKRECKTQGISIDKVIAYSAACKMV